MSDIPQAPTKQEVRAEMDDGLTDFINLIDQYSDEQMMTLHDEVGWTVRDHIVHLAVWAEGIAALLRREDRWAAMGLNIEGARVDNRHYDTMNAQIAHQHRHLSPAEARTWLVNAHEHVAAAVEALPEAALAAPYDYFVKPFTGNEGNPIFEYVWGNTAHHYEEHAHWIKAIIHHGSTDAHLP